jgi:hypothetical protein
MGAVFWLGVHHPSWLSRAGVPLFVSAARLRGRRSFPRAVAPFALDSGGFTQLSLHGDWTVPATQYASEARLWRDEVGMMAWAAQQDWMCEPAVRERTGLSVAEHQRRTVHNYLLLRQLAPDLPWVPVLQGWERDDYMRHLDQFVRAGVDLPSLVGLGSVCRRQDTRMVEGLVRDLAAMGIKLHGFGMKTRGFARVRDALASADSMAWSFQARRSAPLAGCTHRSCANCMRFALRWRERVVSRPAQAAFAW